MSLLDDVSIVVTPNGYKAGELYAVIPSDGAADMDVTRNTAATRVDENGLVNYAEVIGGEEITNGDFATDGTPSTNTWTLGWYSNTANVSISGGKITLTNSASESDSRAYTTNGVSSNNILITNQLYKLQYEVIANNGATSFKYYSSSGVFIDAPIDLGVTHTIYIKNTSNQLFLFQNATTNSNISLDNVSVKEVTRDSVPRIDYTGGGCPHILAEPQRTNLLTYSEDFSNAIWTKSGSSVTPNATTSPEGTINADKLVEDTSTGGHQIQSITSASNSTIYTTSVFVKYAGREWIRFTDAQSSNRIHFNTLTGVFGTISGTVIDYNSTALEDGWYKLSFTTTSVATAYTPRIALAEADNDVSYTGDGVSGVYIWGAQLEQGSYPTSYIPNFGTALGVTRNQDIFTRDGIGSLINSTEGVLFFEMAALSDDGTYRLMNIRDVSNTDNFIYFGYKNASNTIRTKIKVSGAASIDMEFVLSNETEFNKIAIKWKTNDFALWVNGVEVATDSSGVSFTANTLDELSFDRNGSLEFNGKVKQLQVYKTALTDTQLAALTS